MDADGTIVGAGPCARPQVVIRDGTGAVPYGLLNYEPFIRYRNRIRNHD